MALGCSEAKPRTPAQVVWRFSVTAWASLASALKSFGKEHALKGSAALLNPIIRASTSTTGEQTPAPTGLTQPQN